MRRPTTDNSIENGDGNTQVGHNSGTVTIGLTFAEHETALKSALADKERDLERAHQAEQTVLQLQIAEIQKKLENVEEDYQDRLTELAETKAMLARYQNQVDVDKRDAAFAAIDRGDTTLAQALFKELSHKASLRREDAAKEEAELEFELGKLAEAEIRWADAAAHYARAAQLDPSFDALQKASDYAERSGDYEQALRYSGDLVALANDMQDQIKLSDALNEHALNNRKLGNYSKAEALYQQALEIDRATIGEGHPKYATRLNNLALAMKSQGRYGEAEALYQKALEIDRTTIGEGHPDYAARLNNLALAVQAQGRYGEAEALFQQALEIDRATIGEGHPRYALRLNNLAGVFEDQGRYGEAESLYQQAMEIDRTTIGEGHPNYSIRLNNLALAVQAQGRYGEAEALYQQALEIGRATIGEGHPSYAIRLNNLAGVVKAQGRIGEARGLYEQALAIFEATLPADHPHIAAVRKHIAALPDAE